MLLMKTLLCLSWKHTKCICDQCICIFTCREAWFGTEVSGLNRLKRPSFIFLVDIYLFQELEVQDTKCMLSSPDLKEAITRRYSSRPTFHTTSKCLQATQGHCWLLLPNEATASCKIEFNELGVPWQHLCYSVWSVDIFDHIDNAVDFFTLFYSFM